MPYSRTTWENSPSTATPLSATLLNNIEQGIVNLDSVISSLTTKGDLLVYGTSGPTRLAVGATNGHVLTVDSAEATGIKWAAGSGGGGMSLLDSQTFTSSTTYTLPAGSLLVVVECVGSGGGGGGARKSTGTNQGGAGAGGGGGGYWRETITAAELGANALTVTIGAGGPGGARHRCSAGAAAGGLSRAHG